MGQRISTRLRAGRARVFIPPPLDGLPDAGAAYGPRRMRSEYSDAAMRVRRADNAELDIGFATTPQTRTNLMPVPLVDNGPSVAGITTTQVGSGTEFGQPYIDIRWQGTATAAGTLSFRQGAAVTYNPAVHAAVTPGLVYTASVGYRLIAGTAPTATLTIRLIQRGVNGAGIIFGTFYTVPAPTAAMQRAVATDVIFPGVVFAHAQFGYSLAISDTIDVTLRFYSNNLELGIGNIKPLLQRNVPEVVASIGDLDTDNLMRFVAQDNLFQRSREFDDAYWTKAGGAVTANAATAPDGTMTADVFVEDSAAATQHQKTRASFSLITGQTVTLSVFVKRNVGTRQYQLGLSGGAQVASAYFDLGAGAVGAVDQCTAAIEPASEGYWRVSITVLVPSAASYNAFLAMANGLTLGSETYTGDGTSSVAEWGAQLNSGALAPYNATTSAAIGLVTAQSGSVAVWYDQTGNGRNLVQAVAANQPRIVGLSAYENQLVPSTTTTFMTAPVPTVTEATPWTCCAVIGPYVANASVISALFQFNNTIGSRILLGANGATPAISHRVSSTTTQFGALSASETASSVLSFTKDATANVSGITAFLDGVAGSAPAAAIGAFSATEINVLGVSGTSIRLREMVYFDPPITADQRQQLQQNQGAYYGVTVS